MQKLNTLWQLVNAATTVRDIAQHSKSYHFAVNGPVTFYLRAEHADVTLIRWTRPAIQVDVRLQAAFGWRIAAEQDEAGVYVAASRRSMVGGLSSAHFDVRLPAETYLILKLREGRVNLGEVSGTLHIPPADPDGEMRLEMK